MRAALKTAAAAILFPACASCSYDFVVKAAFIDGRLAFVSERDRPQEPPWCLEDFAVVGRQGEIAWAIDDAPYGDGGSCAAGFPLVYGRAPPGARQSVAARPLRLRQLYVVTGFGGDPYVGAFMLFRDGRRLSVENLDPSSPAALAARERFGRQRSRSASTAAEGGG